MMVCITIHTGKYGHKCNTVSLTRLELRQGNSLEKPVNVQHKCSWFEIKPRMEQNSVRAGTLKAYSLYFRGHGFNLTNLTHIMKS